MFFVGVVVPRFRLLSFSVLWTTSLTHFIRKGVASRPCAACLNRGFQVLSLLQLPFLQYTVVAVQSYQRTSMTFHCEIETLKIVCAPTTAPYAASSAASAVLGPPVIQPLQASQQACQTGQASCPRDGSPDTHPIRRPLHRCFDENLQ